MPLYPETDAWQARMPAPLQSGQTRAAVSDEPLRYEKAAGLCYGYSKKAAGLFEPCGTGFKWATGIRDGVALVTDLQLRPHRLGSVHWVRGNEDSSFGR